MSYAKGLLTSMVHCSCHIFITQKKTKDMCFAVIWCYLFSITWNLQVYVTLLLPNQLLAAVYCEKLVHHPTVEITNDLDSISSLGTHSSFWMWILLRGLTIESFLLPHHPVEKITTEWKYSNRLCIQQQLQHLFFKKAASCLSCFFFLRWYVGLQAKVNGLLLFLPCHVTSQEKLLV